MDSLADFLARISKHQSGPILPSPLTTCERSTVEPELRAMCSSQLAWPIWDPGLSSRLPLSDSRPERRRWRLGLATPALHLVVNFSSLLLSTAGVGVLIGSSNLLPNQDGRPDKCDLRRVKDENVFRWIESVLVTVTDHTCSNIISRDNLVINIFSDEWERVNNIFVILWPSPRLTWQEARPINNLPPSSTATCNRCASCSGTAKECKPRKTPNSWGRR
jgi:hypothetical protein